MISLARTGPESLVMTADAKVQEIRHKLNVWGTLTNMDAEMALRTYGTARRLIFFTAKEDNVTKKETYVSENQLEMLLITLISSRISDGLSDISMLPGFIMMRLMGDTERGIEAIRRDIGGEIIDRDPMFRPDIPGTSSIIYFTERSLAKAIDAENIHTKALLVHTRSKGALVQYLSLHGMEYLGDSLGTPDWTDAEIKICDSDGFFNLHRERLLTVVRGMQVGMVLEEKWEREQALTKRTIPVYMMKLYSPLRLQDIKKLTMGLEYNAEGSRFVDFDLYCGDRKISAFTELERNPGETRNRIGMKNRNEIMKNLDMDSISELLRLERAIAELKQKSRTHSE